MQYHLSHITDLMQIPAEHWDECMNDLRAAMVSLHVVRAAPNPRDQRADQETSHGK